MVVKYDVGDVVQMKKAHPCGSDTWRITRTGVDMVMHCCGCEHRVMIPRVKFIKLVKRVVEKSGPEE